MGKSQKTKEFHFQGAVLGLLLRQSWGRSLALLTQHLSLNLTFGKGDLLKEPPTHPSPSSCSSTLSHPWEGQETFPTSNLSLSMLNSTKCYFSTSLRKAEPKSWVKFTQGCCTALCKTTCFGS